MPDVIDNDALAFARVRARLQSPRRVADDLLAAANDPDRLDGVSPTMTRMCAADVLTAGGGQDVREAIAVLRDAVQEAVPGEIEMAQTMLVCAVAESGDPGEAEDLAAAFLRGSPGSGPDVISLLGLAAMMTVTGFLDQPDRWLDELLTRTEGTGGRASGGRLDPNMRRMAERSKERIREIRDQATADGVDPASPAAVREHRNRRPPEADAIGAHPAWPAALGGRLLFWPEAEYGRLVRQLPEVAAVLRSPWRTHTSEVQAAMRAQADQGVSGLALVAGEAGRFAQFVEQFDADPVAAPTMTAFTAAAAEKSAPVPWPPKRRAQCWCGSGRRYHDCCGG
jgi:SEC-C motif